ncbi:MAG: methyltransferase domain-containing protein, partial [Nitrospina sp.]|nr:methyltransferase domain-containing protein [Nitrospina sp.]
MGLLTARPSSTTFVVDDPYFLDVKENPNWQSRFGNDHPLKLEIGFGMGEFLISMAKREPDSNFVGIDFSQDGIKKILENIRSSQLKNILVVFGDVREKLPHLFRAEELNS